MPCITMAYIPAFGFVSMADTPPAEEELQNKLQLYEENQKIPTLSIRDYSYSYVEQETRRALSDLPQRSRFSTKSRISRDSRLPSDLNFSSHHCLNILQSMGQSVYIFDLNCRVVYWNKAARDIFGYALAEALGENVVELIADLQATVIGHTIAQRLTTGENWTGQFPVRSKMGELFSAFITGNPFFDDDGKFIGVICVASKVQPFRENRVPLVGADELPNPDSILGTSTTVATQLEFEHQQPPHNATASAFATLATKFKSRLSAGKHNLEGLIGKGDNLLQGDHSGASSPRGGILPSSPSAILSKIKDKFHKNSRCS